MDKYNDLKNILFQKNWIYIFLVFFLFFMMESSFDLATPIFLEEKNIAYLWGIVMTVNSISLVIMPLLISNFCKHYGNISCAKWSMLFLALVFSLNFFCENIYIVLIFLFPFFIRIFNNSLTPFISKMSSSSDRSKVFAVRDFFLSAGISVGLLATGLINRENVNLSGLINIYTLILLIIVVLLWIYPTDKKQKTDTPTNFNFKKMFQFPWNEIQNKKVTLYFIIIFTGVAWIGTSIAFLPLYATRVGLAPLEIFSSYGISYVIVSLLGIFCAIFDNSHKRREWYIFDLGFDLIPLILICIFTNSFLIILAIILIQLKDFVKPISLAYFFDCFTDSEADHAWAVVATVSSLASLVFPLLISYLFDNYSILIFQISIIVALLITIFGYLTLPRKQIMN